MTVILAHDARKGYARDQFGSEFLTSSVNAKSFAELNKNRPTPQTQNMYRSNRPKRN